MTGTAFRTTIGVHVSLALFVGLSVLRASPDTDRMKQLGEWTPPTNLGDTVNSAYHELLPALAKNGLSLYFASDRPGSLGGEDLWVSRRTNRDAPWGTPVNVGAAVNTAFNERSPVFDSNRPGPPDVAGIGLRDLWVSKRIAPSAPWSIPENLGPTVNSPFNDYLAMLSLDGRTLVMVSDRPEGLGGNDLYIATRARRPRNQR